MSSRRILGPFNRVEGDLEVQLELDGDRVADAWVVSPLYRGYEQILQGKDPRDALVYVPRICGICSVSQSVAAAQALADAAQIAPPPNGRLATNLVLANENVADHLTHFYLFFMPDFARQTYATEPWFAHAEARFKAIKGSAAAVAMPARAEFLNLMGLLAGKWPHSLAIQPGGTTCAIDAGVQSRIATLLHSFRSFLERELFADSLERVVAIDSQEALNSWCDQAPPEQGDLRFFLHLCRALKLDQLGRGYDRFMSNGAYGVGEDKLFPAGLWAQGEYRGPQSGAIREDLTHAWMNSSHEPRHPYEGITMPSSGREQGYSWCKAPRLDGEVMEVGALARQLMAGHPLVQDLVRCSGGNVQNRVVARLLEIARVTLAMQEWVWQIKPREPFCVESALPEEGQGVGMVEAARGSLGHWLKIQRGRLANYQIIAPTTWNFSPRDAREQPGPLELALRGAPLRAGEEDPVAVQHIVRSFDPCMVCTVH
uniref:Uptake hydrogenase accessory protein HupV n=1 Tax=Magnetococcus massalia (strain MO-1) TaxID=451514 RepID=A0A1S7LED0_MAGMO|nr:Uptake hydrogenase accessory protein HupV [Candidatus Magnetococcus massalia]